MSEGIRALKRVKPLHDLGFAIHLLKPKSKLPLLPKWSTGPKLTFSELSEGYRRGMNVGVRLGAASKIKQKSGPAFLAVIDCDVKSEDPKHLREMEAKLKAILQVSGPVVASGRRNGSRHIYVVTEKPASFQRLAQSPEKVKVFMPSAKTASRDETAKLTPDEISDGYRLRAAWEIALMGEGQQVVLPPSIHPDSGKEYVWTTPILNADSLPRYLPPREGTKSLPSPTGKLGKFRPVAVDLVGSTLDEKTYAAITSGEGVTDGSAALLGVTNKMLAAGFSDVEILTVLTDPENYLGEVGYRHAQTEDRARAAEWVRRYTLEKSKKETLASEQFADEVEETVYLSKEAAEAQKAEICPEPDPADWRDQIERTDPEAGFRPKNTLRNVILILTGEGGKDVFLRDEFANSDIYKAPAPWGGRAGAEVTDLDTVLVKEWLARAYRFEPSNDRINEAITHVAHSNRFHPVRDYLDRLEWDGTPRIDSWLKDYLSADAPEPYLSAVSRKTLAAMVRRIYEPGCKFDHVLILEGSQGAGKSTALRMLAGDSWFTDSHINVSDKDSVMTMRSRWLIELGELSGMRSADVELLKEFISRTTDRIRVPYGKRAEDFPRQCVFIGSTNRDEYLKDPTGNRRFWPVKVGACDFRRIERDRDQLLAEAKVAYELGEPLYLEEPEMNEGAVREQNARSVSDPWEEMLEAWIAKGAVSADGFDEIVPSISRESFSILDLFGGGGPLSEWKPNQPEMKRTADVLRKLGFERHVSWDGKLQRTVREWRRKGA